MMMLLPLVTIDAYGETTKKVDFFQRTNPGPLEPPGEGGITDQSQKVTCILYKESGRCVFDPDVETIQKYEIYQGTARVGVYYDQFSFVQDAFNLRGTLILTLTTRNSQLSGKIHNY